MEPLRCLTAVVAVTLSTAYAQAAELNVLASTALKATLQGLGPKFETATGNKVTFSFAPAAVLKGRIDEGAAFDVAILTTPQIEALASAGKVDGANHPVVARGGLGVSMRAGASKPDVSTSAALKSMLLNAKSIGFNGQGASRKGIEGVFDKLGVTEALRPKIRLLTTTAAEGVASDEVEVGLGPISEILATPGAELVGPLPPDVQSYLVLSAGLSTASQNPDAGKAFVKFLTAPDAVPVLKAKGMEPG